MGGLSPPCLPVNVSISRAQREEQPAHDDRIGIHARGERLRTDRILGGESQRGQRRFNGRRVRIAAVRN